MEKINKKHILIIGGFLLGIVFVILLIVGRESKTKTVNSGVVPTIFPSTSFLVKSTVPAKGATNVYPGEIQISFTTDSTINSAKDFSFYLSPPPSTPPKLITKFPSKTVTYQVLGGLKRTTEYTVVVSNKHSQNVAIWSFTTSDLQPESSSGQANEEQKRINDSYYPLFYDVPYENSDFQIDYTDRLTLLAKIKKNKVDEIKKEVFEWIKSKNVNPATHKIIFENNF